ncbi:MAG: ABC transporter ATP-binding protein [Halobacteriales archaeon]|nr:ABC transporter ATP-binding protein [Halobacteriales archaeon]
MAAAAGATWNDGEPILTRVTAPGALACEARGVGKRYGERAVLDGVSLGLRPGDSVLLRGRSGSGKSTLLHVLAGIEPPTEGSAWLAGQDLATLDATARARLRARHVGLVFQHFNLIPDLTAEENVRLPMELVGAKGGKERALDLLQRVEMEAHARDFPGSLSGGELQRVAIARALANDPRLIAADEPTANLDEASALRVFALLAALAADGRAVLVASHDPLALRFFPRRCALHEGRLAWDSRAQS